MKNLGLPLMGSLLLLTGGMSPIYGVPRATREDDIREVLFRQLMPKRAEKIPSPISERSDPDPPDIKAYYFSYWLNGMDRDPSRNFLKRFSMNVPPVRSKSDSYIDNNVRNFGWSNIRDKRTHEYGMRFYIDRIRWLGRNRVNVYAGYTAGGLNAGHAHYWLKFHSGTWMVTKVSNAVVS